MYPALSNLIWLLGVHVLVVVSLAETNARQASVFMPFAWIVEQMRQVGDKVSACFTIVSTELHLALAADATTAFVVFTHAC